MTGHFRRLLLSLVVIAIGVAMLVMFASHGYGGHTWAYFASLPSVFIGLIVFVCTLLFVEALRVGSNSDEPLLPGSFQKPPPFLIA